jgi:hypothetical protein
MSGARPATYSGGTGGFFGVDKAAGSVELYVASSRWAIKNDSGYIFAPPYAFMVCMGTSSFSLPSVLWFL